MNDVQLLWTLCDEAWPDDVLAAARDRVPRHLRDQMPNFRRWQDVQMGLSGKLLLARCLTRAGIGLNVLEQMTWSAEGRPALPIPGDFNVTHSGGLVACVQANTGRLGIDVERIHHVPLDDLAAALMPDERNAIEAEADQDSAFFRVWTFKEAVIKADGRGVGLGLKRIDSRSPRVALDDDRWEVQPLDLHPGYACHLATDVDSSSLQPQRLTIEQLLAP